MIELLKEFQHTFHQVVPFIPGSDRLLLLDCSATNTSLNEAVAKGSVYFAAFIKEQIDHAGALYGIGGYDELRDFYSVSEVFNSIDEPRRLHLGIDIWGRAGTPVYAPLGGVLHSVGFHQEKGNYGAVILLQHQIKATTFYTLYGHLSLEDIQHLKPGKFISVGETIGHFGIAEENGYWPPHLHFQIIKELDNYSGDYPGVCKMSERKRYLENCPDPDIILQMLSSDRSFFV